MNHLWICFAVLAPAASLAHPLPDPTPPEAIASQKGRPREEYANLSPFEMVRWKGQEPEVQVQGKWWRLVSIDGITREDLLAHTRATFGDRWAKRFCEDLIEVLDGMGHTPDRSVDLVLAELDTGTHHALGNVTLSKEHRNRIRDAEPRPEEDSIRAPVAPSPKYDPGDFPRVSPFEMVRWNGEEPEVQVQGKWWRLVSIDGIAREDLLAHARTAFGGRWAKRFCEDISEVLDGLGHTPGTTVELVLSELVGGVVHTLPEVAMSTANRSRIHAAEPRPGKAESAADGSIQRIKRVRPAGVSAEFQPLVRACPEMDAATPRLTREQAAEDLGQLEWLVAHRFSYRDRVGFDWRGAFNALHASLQSDVSEAAFAYKLHKLLTRFGDGHSRLGVSTTSLFLPGALPLRLVRDDFGVATIDPDGALLDPLHPYLTAIDGEPLATWLAAASEIVPIGSDAMTSGGALRRAVHVPQLRAQLARAAASNARLTLSDRSGKEVVRQVSLVDRAVRAPQGEDLAAERLENDIGLLRIGSMGGDKEFLARLDRALDSLAGVSALVIDVRGNGGGSRLPLLHVAPRLMPATLDAVVGNVAALRIDSKEEALQATQALGDRFLHAADWSGWSPAARPAVSECAARFKPSWQPPVGEFSDWHYLVLERESEKAPLTSGPVIVLLDGGCFSATDIFLGAMAQLPNVTLLGSASGGGSGRARGHTLAHSRLPVQLSTMISFLPDGQAYDGHGILPEISAPTTLDDHLGRTDSVLTRAIEAARR